MSKVVFTDQEIQGMPIQVQEAVTRLLTKERRLREKVSRYPAGSNARQVTERLAHDVTECARMLGTDPHVQHALEESGKLAAGWQRLCREIIDVNNARAAEKSMVLKSMYAPVPA
jgi:hypothetical protein